MRINQLGLLSHLVNFGGWSRGAGAGSGNSGNRWKMPSQCKIFPSKPKKKRKKLNDFNILPTDIWYSKYQLHGRYLNEKIPEMPILSAQKLSKQKKDEKLYIFTLCRLTFSVDSVIQNGRIFWNMLALKIHGDVVTSPSLCQSRGDLEVSALS